MTDVRKILFTATVAIIMFLFWLTKIYNIDKSIAEFATIVLVIFNLVVYLFFEVIK